MSGIRTVLSGTRVLASMVAIVALILALGNPVQAAGVRVGFIDIQEAVAGTKEFKRVFTQFRSHFQKEKKLITQRENKIKAMLEDINKQGTILKDAEKRRKEERFLKEKKSFERYVQDKNEEFQRKEKEITDSILRKMLEILKKIGKERKYTMILEKKAVFYSDTAADLTKIATKTYDRIHK
ncbi:MAG: OmpH family outer membrane protein [Candidatus Nitronauta litoralis]|uniref:OmpH family outer membrane protein n=1 Tax=Candidatus Nitronauta litoralis TaxID=2705533 RepID=A0A7T0BUQ9_9BACT|nr:MAG: OmpH family outer membrane protein [Candidatus Nitronauta litoralis]